MSRKNGVDVIRHDHESVTKGFMCFEATLQDFKDDATRAIWREKTTALVGGERDEMGLPREIDDLTIGHGLSLECCFLRCNILS